jgi:hypothetical protein
VTEHQSTTEGQTALDFTAGVMQTFGYNLAVLKSVIAQHLKARVLDFSKKFSQLTAAGVKFQNLFHSWPRRPMLDFKVNNYSLVSFIACSVFTKIKTVVEYHFVCKKDQR